MIILKIALIILLVLFVLFLLTLVIYFFNLDMKMASKMIPIMNKIYDRSRAKKMKKKDLEKNESLR